MPQITRRGHSKNAENLLSHGPVAVKILREVADATNVPYLKTISGVGLLIFETAQVSGEIMRLTFPYSHTIYRP